MSKSKKEKQTLPPQHQGQQPGKSQEMEPKPKSEDQEYAACGLLQNKVAVITGGDSGIGRAVAVAYAKEGADVAIIYLNEHEDAAETKRLVEQAGGRCLTISGDVGDESFCRQAVQQVIDTYNHVDVLVNNAGEQHPQDSIEKISSEQLERTFRTNIFGMFYMTKAVLPHMREGSSAIVNTASITAYEGNPELIDYAATKGAIVAFTRSLSLNLEKKGIRVNAVAPGPIWTPLIPASYNREHVSKFGGETPMGRPGQPNEVAPSYVFLASERASYMSGQVLHPNGGTIVNG